MILARFRYDGHILGEWTEINPDGPMMVPNREYAGRLLGVEFMQSQNETPAKPKRHQGRAWRLGTVANGNTADIRSDLISHLHTHPDHAGKYNPGHDFMLVPTVKIIREHETQHETIGDHGINPSASADARATRPAPRH